MKRKYILFHTGKAAVFLFYASVIFLLFLVYIKLNQKIPQVNLIAGSIFYVCIMVSYALRIDRNLHKKSQLELKN
jgi:hypothetical protein